MGGGEGDGVDGGVLGELQSELYNDCEAFQDQTARAFLKQNNKTVSQACNSNMIMWGFF